MKNLLRTGLLLVPAVLIFSSCLRTNDDNVTPTNFLKGKYQGKFALVKVRGLSPTRLDTLRKANISIELNDEGYAVMPDSLGVHSASKGVYAYGNYYGQNIIEFSDQNVTDTTGKIGLKGQYIFAAKGSGNIVDSLNMQTASLGTDSIVSLYKLKKTAN